jgi:hypothetical protein
VAPKGTSAIVTAPGEPRAAEAVPWTLSVAIRLDRAGPTLLREPVKPSDLIDPLAECWLEAVLRKGGAHVGLEALRQEVVPLFSESGATCLGYTLEVTGPEGHSGRRDFTIYSLKAVAQRGVRRLIARGDIRDGDHYYYEVRADASPAAAASSSTEDTPSLAGRAATRPPDVLDVPIAPLLAEGRAVGPQDEDTFRVFYTEKALGRAETVSRKGAAASEPVETGGVLIGTLARCPDSGDFFVLVLDVLEAADAEQREFSLFYSSRTWERIQTVMRAMQSRPATRTYRIVGQCHGHNFLPSKGNPPCEACPHLAVCEQTSVCASADDISWARAVFRRQPWHLGHVFGFSARREKVSGLFGLRDGRLLERGFHVIPGFELES